MKAAVIGGGTAGFMAAAHLSRRFPEVELLHVYDSRIPAIGVGEGTTPRFPVWLHDIVPLTYRELQRSCFVTRKTGIRFEGWGAEGRPFYHYFVPTDQHALHVSAERLPDVLQPRIKATRLDTFVERIETGRAGVTICLGDGGRRRVDVIIDARGFPKRPSNEEIALAWIPTNTAIVMRGPSRPSEPVTRAVARPHGWVFVIPLTRYTSYGYIFNSSCSEVGEVRADFSRFLEAEGVPPGEPRQLAFPNFVRKRLYRDGVFMLGNSAAFAEPLEATAIAVVEAQLQLVSLWLVDRLKGISQDDEARRQVGEVLNKAALELMLELSVFVGWHYSAGSVFDSPFWRFAKANFVRALRELPYAKVKARFAAFLERGRRLSSLAPQAVASQRDFERFVDAGILTAERFGGFGELSFSQLCCGLGEEAAVLDAERPE